MKNEKQQHIKNCKQLLYAGLATVTLIGGMGATPVVLAEELLIDQTEIVDKNDKRDKNDQSDEKREGEATGLVVTTPEPLPEVDLSPAVQPESVAASLPDSGAKIVNDKLSEEAINKKVTAKIAAETAKRAKQSKVVAAKPVAPKTQNPRVDLTGYEFGVADFVIVDGTITDFSDAGRAIISSPDWDKVIRFDSAIGDIVTAIGDREYINPSADNYDPAIVAPNVEEIDLSKLVKLEVLSVSSFGSPDGQTLKTVKFSESLTTIGQETFLFFEKLTNIEFNNLPNLVSIGDDAFAGCPFTKIDLSGAKKLETIGHSAFWDSRITELNLDDLPSLKTIGYSAFFHATQLTKISLTRLPALEFIAQEAFEMTPYGNLSKLQQITIGDINPDAKIGKLVFNGVKAGGIVIPINKDSLGVANKLVDAINNNNYVEDCGCFEHGEGCTCDNPFPNCDCGSLYFNDFTGDDAWYITATATQKYVDEQGDVITQDINGNAITPPKTNGKIGEQYALADAPVIPGYDAPELVAGDNAGTYDELWEEATYKYTRAKAAKFTVYYVDENDQEIATKQELEDVPEAEFDLTPQAIAGYDFKELFGTKVEVSRAVTDFDWEVAHELIDQKVKFGDNNGRSYKFVYTKKAATPDDTTKPDGGTSTNKPAEKPTTTPTNKPATTTDTTPNNQPTTIDKTPGTLPSSGGDKAPSKQKNNKPAGGTTVVNNTTTKANATAKDPTLPKSGNAKNYVLPVLGATVLTGLLGLYAFSKKRKS